MVSVESGPAHWSVYVVLVSISGNVPERLVVLAHPGLNPVTSKCFCSSWVKGGRKEMQTVMIKLHEP